MMEITAVVTKDSLRRLAVKMETTLARVRDVAIDEFPSIGKEIMDQSFELVPKSSGALAHSGYVGDVVISYNRIGIKLGYGGPNDKVNPYTGKLASTYAWAVHEDLNAYHPDGQAKYLEIPISLSQIWVAERLMSRIRDVLRVM